MAEPALAAPDLPNVIMPPPLVFTIGMAVGLGMDRALRTAPPLARVRPPAALRPLGGALVLGASALLVRARLALRRARTPVCPYSATTALATDGPYASLRNPIYGAYFVAYVGVALIARATVPFVTLLKVAEIVSNEIVAREETYLERRFGGAYAAYRERVSRWS